MYPKKLGNREEGVPPFLCATLLRGRPLSAVISFSTANSRALVFAPWLLAERKDDQNWPLSRKEDKISPSMGTIRYKNM